jgi:hypothetical protein
MTEQSIPVSNNQPFELFEAQSRIAHLEAKMEQADYLLGEALRTSSGYDDVVQKVEMARKTLMEGLGHEPDLMPVA